MNNQYFQEKDIWQIRLNIDNQDIIGHEQDKDRPCLILKVFPGVKLAIIIPISHILRTQRFSYTKLINKSPSNGLNTDSVALIFQVRSVSFDRFLRKYGIIENFYWDSIKDLLSDCFDIDQT